MGHLAQLMMPMASALAMPMPLPQLQMGAVAAAAGAAAGASRPVARQNMESQYLEHSFLEPLD